MMNGWGLAVKGVGCAAAGGDGPTGCPLGWSRTRNGNGGRTHWEVDGKDNEDERERRMMQGTKVRRGLGSGFPLALLVGVAVTTSGCGELWEDVTATGPQEASGFNTAECSIPQGEIFPGGPGKDGIPALTDPEMVTAGGAWLDYLSDRSRVIGIETADGPYAVPLNILWWHEIVNLNLEGVALAVTHCPLTGSSMVFDRTAVDGAEFGVSGLLYHNNLIMYDRRSEESLWPQMARGARCGPRDGTGLPMYPAIEMEWGDWRALHPQTRVVSGRTGHPRDYTWYPYGNYDDPDNHETLFPAKIDDRRPPKERVLGIPGAGESVAYPFGLLADHGRAGAVNDTVDGRPVVVFWSGAGRAALPYDPVVNGRVLVFEAPGDSIVDRQTGSVWTVDGRAVAGPLAGGRLEPIADAYVAYWFAWAIFHPESRLWNPDA
jgi:hypothetical protein